MDNNSQDNLTRTISKVIGNYKQYRMDGWKSLIVSKVWNRGQGLLPLFRFYQDKKIILINSRLFNRFDEKHLSKIKKAIGAESWKEVNVEYGYPDYYFKSFNLNLAKDEC